MKETGVVVDRSRYLLVAVIEFERRLTLGIKIDPAFQREWLCREDGERRIVAIIDKDGELTNGTGHVDRQLLSGD